MSKDNVQAYFQSQMEAIVLILLQIFFAAHAVWKLANIQEYF